MSNLVRISFAVGVARTVSRLFVVMSQLRHMMKHRLVLLCIEPKPRRRQEIYSVIGIAEYVDHECVVAVSLHRDIVRAEDGAEFSTGNQGQRGFCHHFQ